MFARLGHYSVCRGEGRAAAELQLMPLSASKGECQCWDSGVVGHLCPGPQPRLLAEGPVAGFVRLFAHEASPHPLPEAGKGGFPWDLTPGLSDVNAVTFAYAGFPV